LLQYACQRPVNQLLLLLMPLMLLQLLLQRM
jgi:hypothetical protein